MPRGNQSSPATTLVPASMTAAKDPVYLSAAEQGRLIRARKLSPVELIRACLARIERFDGLLRAYITVCADQAVEQARTAEREVMAGNYRGPLHGIPFGVKDQLCTRGVRTTLGSRIFRDHVPKHDATVIERLYAAGAILVGKENLHEFGKGGDQRFPLWPAAQSLESRVHPFLVLERLGHRACGRVLLGFTGRGYRRFYSGSGSCKRSRRAAPDLRARKPARRHHARLDQRYDWSAHPDGGGQRDISFGDRGS